MPQERRLAAIMFTDIVGYTSHMEEDEKRAFQLLEKNRKIHKPIIKKFRGKWLKEMGDGILVTFQTTSDAVYCAIEIQEICKNEPHLKLRIGIHLGEVTFQGEDVFGSGVNIASRLVDMASIGGIYVSEAVYRNVQNKSGIKAEYIGEETLKNVKHPIKVYEILAKEGIAISAQISQIETKSKNQYLIIVGLVAILVIVGLIWIYLPKKSSSNIDPNLEKSIAILPFKNLSPEEENQYFCDGVMEGVLNNLSQMKNLRVLSRSSTDKYRESTPPVPQIAEELNVNYLVEASVFKSENRIRVTAQLIDARNDEHIWSKQYDKEIQDIFNVMSDVSKAVASEIQVAISPEIKERIESIPTNNQEAYDYYLRGKEYEYKYLLSGSESDLNTVIQFYNRAILEDTTFSLAISRFGYILFLKNRWDNADTMKFYAEEALALNPNLAEGYLALGLYYGWTGDIKNIIFNASKAIELNPNLIEAYEQLGVAKWINGEYVESVLFLNKGRNLTTNIERDWSILNMLGMVYNSIGMYKESEEIYKELSTYHPLVGYNGLATVAREKADWNKFRKYTDMICLIDSGADCFENLSSYYIALKNLKEALKFQKEYYEESKIEIEEDRYNVSYPYILLKLGEVSEAQELFQNQIAYMEESITNKEGWEQYTVAEYHLAAIYSILGDNDKALKIIHNMEDNNFYFDFNRMKHDIYFSDLRNNEEFKTIIKEQEKNFADIRKEVDRLEQEGLL